MNIVTFPRDNGDHTKLVVDFLLVKDTFRKKKKKPSRISSKKVQQQRQTQEIVNNFACEAKKPETSSEISHSSFLFFFLHFSSFFFIFPFFSFFHFFV